MMIDSSDGGTIKQQHSLSKISTPISTRKQHGRVISFDDYASPSLFSTTSQTPTSPITPIKIGGANTILTRKVASAIATASSLGENEKLRTSIQYIGSFYDFHNSTQQRRELQGQLEKKALETHDLLLTEFLRVNDQLAMLDSVVSELNNTCNMIDQRLQMNREKSRQFLANIKSLNESIQESERRQQTTKHFLEQFQLTEQERNIIIGGKVDGSFFSTLKKVHDIYNQCTEMLRNEQQKAGLEILEEMSNYQDNAYERLSRWIQQKCKYLAALDYSTPGTNFFDSDDNIITDPEEMEIIVEEELKCALDALAERPVLLNCCLEEIKNARKNSIVQRFFEALTKGANKGVSRPIDMQAHDPLRYVGDILAWVHQSAASERELIDNILSVNDKSDISSRKVSNNQITRSKMSFEILDKIFESLNSHLRIRVQQVLTSSSKETLVVYFRVSHLLELYSFTIGKLLGEGSALPLYLLELKTQSMNKFFHVLEKSVNQIVVDDIQVPEDLSPPESIKEMMDKLHEIMSTYSKSVVPEERREEDFNQVLSSVTDPLLTKLDTYFEMEKKKNNQLGVGRSAKMSDVHVFLINCYFLIQNSLGSFSFTTRKLEQVSSLIDRHVELFVIYQSDMLLDKCGLQQKISLIKTYNQASGVPISSTEGLERDTMAQFMQQFYENLFSLGSQLLTPQRQCYQIASARLRVYTQNRIASDLANAYTLLYQTIHDSANKYERPEEFAYHSPQQVMTLLEL